MTPRDHGPDAGPDATATATATATKTPARKPRGVDPLSHTHRRRVLKALADAAAAGISTSAAQRYEELARHENIAEMAPLLRGVAALVAERHRHHTLAVPI